MEPTDPQARAEFGHRRPRNSSPGNPFFGARLSPGGYSIGDMNYHSLGHSGLRVSELCLGTMTFGEDWGGGGSPQECRKMFEVYFFFWSQLWSLMICSISALCSASAGMTLKRTR